MYYQIEKEKAFSQIRVLAPELIVKLEELESEEGLINTLPFYGEVIELLKMGYKINDVDRYYRSYQKTLIYSMTSLSYIIRSLQYDIYKSSFMKLVVKIPMRILNK